MGLLGGISWSAGWSPAAAESLILGDPVGAARMVMLANEDRAAAGLAPLRLRSDVFDIADEHSRRMATANDLFHNDAYFTAEVRQRLGARSLGENVALNRSVDDAHARLMQSPGHRANLLSAKFTVVGMAVVRDADGLAYITQDFVEPVAAPAPTPQPEPAAEPAAEPATSTDTTPPGGAAEDGTPPTSTPGAGNTRRPAGARSGRAAAGARSHAPTGAPPDGAVTSPPSGGQLHAAPAPAADGADGADPVEAPTTTARASVSVVTEPISSAATTPAPRGGHEARLLAATLGALAVLAISGSVFRVLRRPTDSGV